MPALASQADAADLYGGSIKDTYVEPAPAPVVKWTGFYISAGLGGSYTFTDLDGGFEAGVSGFGSYANAGTEFGGNAGIPNFFGSVGVGYDFQVAPQFVIGILADYDFSSSNKASVGSGAGFDASVNLGFFSVPAGGGVGGEVTAEAGDTWSVGGRLGFLATKKTLIYALGGYTEAQYSLKGSFGGGVYIDGIGIDVGPYAISSGNSWRRGWFIGGGMETLLTDSLSLKLEYRYAQYDGGSIEFEDGSPVMAAAVAAYSSSVGGGASMSDPEVHSVRAALSWRFNTFGY